jgi:hypothetical protein
MDESSRAKVQFTYEAYANPNSENSKAVFITKTQKIVVKFTEAYNEEEAHSLLAANGLAPPLLSRVQSTIPGFMMVVMGHVPEVSSVDP